jgi:CRISPR/Cas system-associated endonuclease Cas3-HD
VERLATFRIKRVVLAVREVVEDGILVHDTGKKGIDVTYNIV